MAWHIIRIEPAENDTRRERDALPICEQIAVRGTLRDIPVDRLEAVLLARGYELGPIVGLTPASEWPLTAYIYTSVRRDGVGRSGSTLRRWPVRRRG